MKKMVKNVSAVMLLLAAMVPQASRLNAAEAEAKKEVKTNYSLDYHDDEIQDDKMFMGDFDKRGDYDFVQLNKQKHPSIFSVGWTPIQLGAYATIFEEPVNVYGLNINICSSATNNFCGISLAGLDNSQTGANYGINMAYMIFAKRENYFLNASLINVNYAQNYALSAALFLNYGYNKGIQAGSINVGEGVQMGGFNYSFNDNAVQFGGINITKSGWQFGLFNYNEKAWLKWFPVFNYSSSEDDAF